MSKITQADADFIVRKAEAIALFSTLVGETKDQMRKERAAKEMEHLKLFVNGIAIVPPT